ncbi:MAG: alpha/beta hydrolase, partial [Atopobiaceae bacterium]|nr:alpha/beta hydrolase [Atopobiaceae bacterium]
MAQETAYTRNPLMEGFTEGRFRTSDGVSLRYLHAGTGTPLIMVPGWAGTADTFSLNAPDFAQDNEVFVLDMRGHGFSEVPAYGAQIARLSADLAEFSVWVGAPKVNLIGHSMGCCVLWGYMELFGQDRIEHAVFIDEAPLLTANPEDSDEEVRLYGGNRIDPWTLT